MSRSHSNVGYKFISKAHPKPLRILLRLMLYLGIASIIGGMVSLVVYNTNLKLPYVELDTLECKMVAYAGEAPDSEEEYKGAKTLWRIDGVIENTGKAPTEVTLKVRFYISTDDSVTDWITVDISRKVDSENVAERRDSYSLAAGEKKEFGDRFWVNGKAEKCVRSRLYYETPYRIPDVVFFGFILGGFLTVFLAALISGVTAMLLEPKGEKKEDVIERPTTTKPIVSENRSVTPAVEPKTETVPQPRVARSTRKKRSAVVGGQYADFIEANFAATTRAFGDVEFAEALLRDGYANNLRGGTSDYYEAVKKEISHRKGVVRTSEIAGEIKDFASEAVKALGEGYTLDFDPSNPYAGYFAAANCGKATSGDRTRLFYKLYGSGYLKADDLTDAYARFTARLENNR